MLSEYAAEQYKGSLVESPPRKDKEAQVMKIRRDGKTTLTENKENQ